MQCHQYHLEGFIQGVGFRPWVHKTASQLSLNGVVFNSTNGVVIEVEGSDVSIASFDEMLKNNASPGEIKHLAMNLIDAKFYDCFKILVSSTEDSKNVPIIPDRSVCDDCLSDLYEPTNKRYLYPFITCASCGPRFTIVNKLPFDRDNTTMVDFPLCSCCLDEYQDINNHRYHAQTISCPACGPQLELYSSQGQLLVAGNNSLRFCIDSLLAGEIMLIKGLGGYNLVVDATNDAAVSILRDLKKRQHKPFAIMLNDVEDVKSYCQVDELEEQLLTSSAAPIVLLKKKRLSALSHQLDLISEEIAFNLNQQGILLPYTGLHHILLKEVGRPLVVTSANSSGFPICYKLSDCLEQFSDKVAGILSNNRQIHFPCDDSVVRVVNNKPMMIRRARGYSLMLDQKIEKSPAENQRVAVGTHMKNSIAIQKGERVFVSPYLGDMDNVEQLQRFNYYHQALKNLLAISKPKYSVDLHPEFLTSQAIAELDKHPTKIQHHKAHAYSSLFEYDIKNDCYIITWDGTGLGEDDLIWGGESFIFADNKLHRDSCFEPFYLLGIQAAIREPRRVALTLLWEIYNDNLPDYWQQWAARNFSLQEYKVLQSMWQKKVQVIETTSAGRFFDAIAALLELCCFNDFDGHAPMLLEAQAELAANQFIFDDDAMSTNLFKTKYNWGSVQDTQIRCVPPNKLVIWSKWLKQLLSFIDSGMSKQAIAFNFHTSLAKLIVTMVKDSSYKELVLTGGVFQNKLLCELVVKYAKKHKIFVYTPGEIPVNDSGLSVGQIIGCQV